VRLSRGVTVARLVFAVLVAGMVPMGGLGGLMGPSMAQAQNLGMRVVEGTVVNADTVPLAGATVFLKDLKSKNIRSYTSDSEGKYRFTQVNMAEDHELWAEKDGKKSAVKTVSSWDTRKDFVTELKVK
jgi:Carboxypeptidase regulatory-like domain